MAEFYKHTIGVEYDIFDRGFLSDSAHRGFETHLLKDQRTKTAVVKEALMKNSRGLNIYINIAQTNLELLEFYHLIVRDDTDMEFLMNLITLKMNQIKHLALYIRIPQLFSVLSTLNLEKLEYYTKSTTLDFSSMEEIYVKEIHFQYQPIDIDEGYSVWNTEFFDFVVP